MLCITFGVTLVLSFMREKGAKLTGEQAWKLKVPVQQVK
jgi:hypothetical protein